MGDRLRACSPVTASNSVNLLLILLLPLAATHTEIRYDGHKVYRVLPKTEAHRTLLEEYLHNTPEADVWKQGTNLEEPVDIRVPPHHVTSFQNHFRSHDIPHNTFIDDVQVKLDRSRRSVSCDLEGELFDCYHNYDQIMDWLDDMVAKCPDSCSLFSIGESTEGRKLKVIKIGKPGRNKPKLWIDAGIHAREWIAPAAAMYVIYELIMGREDSARTKRLVEEFDWYILPIINTDGYVYSWTADRLWRKTRSCHDTQDGCCGVDANRNFDFKWRNDLRAVMPCSNTYAGPAPFSEPEAAAVARALRALAGADGDKPLLLYLTLHSYSQLWMAPWGWTTHLPSGIAQLFYYASTTRRIRPLRSISAVGYRSHPCSNIYPGQSPLSEPETEAMAAYIRSGVYGAAPAVTAMVNARVNATVDATVNTPFMGTLNGVVNGAVHGEVDGIVNGTVNCTVNGAVNGIVIGTVIGRVNGTINDPVLGAINAIVTGTIIGKVIGTVSGIVNGAVNAMVDGKVDGMLNGTVTGTVIGTVNGTVDGAINGTVNGDINRPVHGTADGIINGAVDGTVDGEVDGEVDGIFDGEVTEIFDGIGNETSIHVVNGTVNTTVNGEINGIVNGTFVGTFNGTLTGNVNGAVHGTVDWTKIPHDWEMQWKLYLTFHSYGQLWMAPWGYTEDKIDTYDETIEKGQKAVDAIRGVHGLNYTLGAASTILYKSSGTSRDWAYALGIPYVYTVELRDTGTHGFILPPEQIRPCVEELWAGVNATVYALLDDAQ